MGAESPLMLMALSILCLCALTMTVTLLTTAAELRRMARRVNHLLPQGEAAVRQANTLLTRANHATQQAGQVIHQASQAALGWIEQATELKRKAQSLMAGRFGNGHHAGAGPRRSPGRRR